MSVVLATPGHNLVLDTLVMYGLIDRLFEEYYWVEGEVALQGLRYLISLEHLRPPRSLPPDIQQYAIAHSCGGRRGVKGKTAHLDISPVSGKFERIGPKWMQYQYRVCSTCKELAVRGREGYAGKRRGGEYWVLSPVKIQIPLILSIKGLQIPQSVAALGEKVELPSIPALLALLSVLPSPLPGKSWLFSIYAIEGRRLSRASVGIRADNIRAFVRTIRREYLRFPRLIKKLIKLAKTDPGPLIRLADVAMRPSLSLAYAAVRVTRSALEGVNYDFKDFDKFAHALIKWCRASDKCT